MELTKLNDFLAQVNELKSTINILDSQHYVQDLDDIKSQIIQTDDIRCENYDKICTIYENIENDLQELMRDCQRIQNQLDENFDERIIQSKLEIKQNLENLIDNFNHQIPNLQTEEIQLQEELSQLDLQVNLSDLPDDTTVLKLHIYRQLGFDLIENEEGIYDSIQIRSSNQNQTNTIKLNQSNYSEVFLTNRLWDLAS